MKLDDAAAHLEALEVPPRGSRSTVRILRAGAAGLPVGRLQDKLKIAPSTLSHHIKALVVVGLVTQVREVLDARMSCQLRADAGSDGFSCR